MAQPLDPLRLKGTMLDTRKAAARNLDKTGKEQRHPGGEELLLSKTASGGGGSGSSGSAGAGAAGAGDAMQVE